MSSITKRGIWNTVSLLLPEVLFDLKYGTDTFKLVSNDELTDVTSSSKTFGGPYQGANPKLFLKVFRDLLGEFIPRFSEEVFIDFGCGKGRTLLMAAELGFRRVIGVEYSAQLCETANRNVEIFRRRASLPAVMDVVHADATAYEIPSDVRVFFLFNPFGPPVLDSVLENIARSLRTHPRSGYVIYMNPQHPRTFEAAGFVAVKTWGADHRTPDAILYKGPAS